MRLSSGHVCQCCAPVLRGRQYPFHVAVTRVQMEAETRFCRLGVAASAGCIGRMWRPTTIYRAVNAAAPHDRTRKVSAYTVAGVVQRVRLSRRPGWRAAYIVDNASRNVEEAIRHQSSGAILVGIAAALGVLIASLQREVVARTQSLVGWHVQLK